KELDAEMSDNDLAARALAAAAAKRALDEKEARQREQERQEREAAENRAYRAALTEGASKVAFEQLDYKVPAENWEVYEEVGQIDDDSRGTGLAARTEIMGIIIRTGVFFRWSKRIALYLADGTGLTLASFGEAIEALQATKEDG